MHERIANVKRGDRAYCISHVYVDGRYSHDTIEDYDRGLDESMTEKEIARIKVQDKTAIPTGHYIIKMNVQSPKFNEKPFYRQNCQWPLKGGGALTGCVPRFEKVKGFSGVLTHCGKDERSSSGCPIVGRNTKVGEVTDSQATFLRFYKVMLDAAKRGETIGYTVTRKYKI